MIRSSLFSLSILTALTAPAFAEGLVATQTVERAVITEAADGSEIITFQQTDEIAPGDQLRYLLTYSNEGEADATNVRLVMPVPSAVEMIEGSADMTGAIVTYSINGGESFAARDALIIADETGSRAADVSDITHIRWTLASAIPAGATGTISYSGVLQ